MVLPRARQVVVYMRANEQTEKDGVANVKTAVLYSTNGTGLLPDFDTKIYKRDEYIGLGTIRSKGYTIGGPNCEGSWDSRVINGCAFERHIHFI